MKNERQINIMNYLVNTLKKRQLAIILLSIILLIVQIFEGILILEEYKTFIDISSLFMITISTNFFFFIMSYLEIREKL